MARKLIVTAPAEEDVRDIRRYTAERYGRIAASAYDRLLKQALRDLRDDPYRPGSRERPEVAEGVRSYHAAFSRSRAGSRIRSPRHFILYHLPSDGEVVVNRILHDTRDLRRHLPS